MTAAVGGRALSEGRSASGVAKVSVRPAAGGTLIKTFHGVDGCCPGRPGPGKRSPAGGEGVRAPSSSIVFW
eukprot:5249972-Heterocapsa_arctica.AAC.1